MLPSLLPRCLLVKANALKMKDKMRAQHILQEGLSMDLSEVWSWVGHERSPGLSGSTARGSPH